MNTTFKATRILLFLFLLCGGLYYAKDFLVPITFGGLLAMLFTPVSIWLESKGMNKALAALLCVLLFTGMLAAIIALLSWQVAGIAQDAAHLTEQLNRAPGKIQEYIHQTIGIPVEQQKQMIKEHNLTSKAGAKVAEIANSTASLLGMTLLVIIYIFLFIYYREHLKEFVLRMVKPDNKEKAKKIMESSSKVSQQYISGLAMMIGVLWIMYGLGFSLVGVKHALFFAVFCGLLELMPYVGNLTGSVLTAIMALSQGGSTMALWVLAVYAFVQFTQTYLLEPLVVGARVSINPLCTIVAIIVGEMIWGIPGMILAIPVLGIIKIVCDNISWLQPIGFLIGEIKQRQKKRPATG